MAVEEVAALHRRFENGKPEDVWDLWKWFALSDAQSAGFVGSRGPAPLLKESGLCGRLCNRTEALRKGV
jgi:hypothetical protein